MRTLRISSDTLGNGFVESIANATLIAIRVIGSQPRCEVLPYTYLCSKPTVHRVSAALVGKNDNASLVSLAADAYLNEDGHHGPTLFPEENTSSNRFVGFGSGFDLLPEP